MANVTHQIEIDNYELNGGLIEVHYNNPQDEENMVININRATFEDFLRTSGRLNGTMSLNDELASYTIAIPDYWAEVDLRIKYADLKAYLLLIAARDEVSKLKKITEFLYDWLANTGAVAYAGVMTEAYEEIEQRQKNLAVCLPCFGKEVHAVTTDIAV